MHVYRLVPLLVLFLVLTSGQFLQLIERAYAACCPAWRPNCVNWSSLVYGTAEPLGTVSDEPMFRITDDQGYHKNVKADPQLFAAFKAENVSKDWGFSIVKIVNGEPTLIAFVPLEAKEHKPPKDNSAKGPGAAVIEQNKVFRDPQIGNATPPMRGKS